MLRFRIANSCLKIHLRQLLFYTVIYFTICYKKDIDEALDNFFSPSNSQAVSTIKNTYLLYRVPLSISMGVTILVGFEVGAGRMDDAKVYSYLCVGTAVLFSFLSALVLFLYREPNANLFSTDGNVIAYAVEFLVYAAIFQLSDAIQAPVQGALRGYKDVTITLIMAILSYWVIGLPVGFLLATYTDFGPFGYWIGLVTGLAAGAITLSIRLLLVQRKYKTV